MSKRNSKDAEKGFSANKDHSYSPSDNSSPQKNHKKSNYHNDKQSGERGSRGSDSSHGSDEFGGSYHTPRHAQSYRGDWRDNDEYNGNYAQNRHEHGSYRSHESHDRQRNYAHDNRQIRPEHGSRQSPYEHSHRESRYESNSQGRYAGNRENRYESRSNRQESYEDDRQRRYEGNRQGRSEHSSQQNRYGGNRQGHQEYTGHEGKSHHDYRENRSAHNGRDRRDYPHNRDSYGSRDGYESDRQNRYEDNRPIRPEHGSRQNPYEHSHRESRYESNSQGRYAGNRENRYESRSNRQESYEDDRQRHYEGNRQGRQEHGSRRGYENRDQGRSYGRDERPRQGDKFAKPQGYKAQQSPHKGRDGAQKKLDAQSYTMYRSKAVGTGYAEFLPMNRADMEARGWKELDILLVSGDAYIDHPAFAAALLGRYLESHGFKVGIITQPDWRSPDVSKIIQEMGRPRLFAGVSAGAVDSMLAHYTAFRKKRHDDAYTPGGDCGQRPNRAIAVYTNILRQAFPNLPVVGGGIEASLRRLSHYDFWTDAVRKSIIADAKLDLCLFGMGEQAILELAQRLQTFYVKHPELTWDSDIVRKSKNKKPWQEAICGIDGSARLIKNADIVHLPQNTVILPSHNDILRSPQVLMEATLLAEKHVHHGDHILVQPVDSERAVLVEKPAKPISQKDMDALYDLPYTRRAHPRYKGKIPAETMMETSLTCHRGCGGGCSFCSLALHQGRHISSRSKQSLLKEAKKIAENKNFTGSISDVGGPSANMWQARCALKDREEDIVCNKVSCMTPKLCPNFIVDQNEHLNLLRDIKKIRSIKHVRVASGVRFDLAITQRNALEAYTGEFTGGQLKVAPEHCSKNVLELMRKPQMEEFETFLQAFYGYCHKMGKEQYVVPYLLSAFPGCSDENMRELAAWLKERNWKPQQVQCFVPTPGTVASAMFHAECDPKGKPIIVAKTDAERLRQHGILMGTAVQPNDKSFYE